jgi:hypothetical protein
MRTSLLFDFVRDCFDLPVFLAAAENELRRESDAEESERQYLNGLNEKRNRDRRVSRYPKLSGRECIDELEEPDVARRGSDNQAHVDAEQAGKTSGARNVHVCGCGCELESP